MGHRTLRSSLSLNFQMGAWRNWETRTIWVRVAASTYIGILRLCRQDVKEKLAWRRSHPAGFVKSISPILIRLGS